LRLKLEPSIINIPSNMAATKEELQERAQLVRIHEANCNIPFPTPAEANFRLAIMKKLAEQYHLKELRTATIDGPVTGIATRTTKRDS
jgi:predicted PP-loop superfamily ATPase